VYFQIIISRLEGPQLQPTQVKVQNGHVQCRCSKPLVSREIKKTFTPTSTLLLELLFYLFIIIVYNFKRRICLAGVREEGDYIYKGILEYKKLSEVFNEAVDTNKCARNHERWSSSSIGNSVPVGKNVYEEMLFQSLLKERENNSLFLQQLVRDRLQSTVVSGVSALSTDEVETSSSHFRVNVIIYKCSV